MRQVSQTLSASPTWVCEAGRDIHPYHLEALERNQRAHRALTRQATDGSSLFPKSSETTARSFPRKRLSSWLQQKEING